MQIGGEETGRRGLCFYFFSEYMILFANKTGSKIKKHVGVSTWGGVRPIGGVYDPNPKGEGRKPLPLGRTPPSYLPLCVSCIIIFLSSYFIFK